MSFIVRGLSSVLGTVLPCFYSYKALKKPTNSKLTEWLQYWSVYGAYTTLDWIANTFFISCFIPFYDVLSLLFVIYISVPRLGGANFVYKKILAPFLRRKERQFDVIIAKAVSTIYALAPTILSNAVQCITDMISTPVICEIQDEEDSMIPRNRYSSVVALEPQTNPIQSFFNFWLSSTQQDSRMGEVARSDNLETNAVVRLRNSRVVAYDTEEDSDDCTEELLLNDSIDLSIVKDEPMDDYNYGDETDVQQYVPPVTSTPSSAGIAPSVGRRQPSRLAKINKEKLIENESSEEVIPKRKRRTTRKK